MGSTETVETIPHVMSRCLFCKKPLTLKAATAEEANAEGYYAAEFGEYLIGKCGLCGMHRAELHEDVASPEEPGRLDHPLVPKVPGGSLDTIPAGNTDRLTVAIQGVREEHEAYENGDDVMYDIGYKTALTETIANLELLERSMPRV